MTSLITCEFHFLSLLLLPTGKSHDVLPAGLPEEEKKDRDYQVLRRQRQEEGQNGPGMQRFMCLCVHVACV